MPLMRSSVVEVGDAFPCDAEQVMLAEDQKEAQALSSQAAQ